MSVWLASILTFAFAAPLTAAELVAIRVGDHPTFTRVVFEFDVAGGYRIERNAAGEAANVVRVTLDAASDGRRIDSSSPGVASVAVEAGSPRSVARIDAREPSWPIKEMILTDPPRVVLDFLRPQPAAAPASPPKVAAAEPAEKNAAEKNAAEKNAAEKKETVAPVAPPEPALSEGEADSLVADAASDVPSDASTAQVDLADSAVEEAAPVEPETATDDYAAASATDSDLLDERNIPAAAPADELPPEPAKREDPASASSKSFSAGTAGAIGAALLVLLAVAFVVMRRRASSKEEDMDVTAMFPEEGAADDQPVPKEGFRMEAPPQDASDSVAERFEANPAGPISVAAGAAAVGVVATGPDSPDSNSPGAAPGIFDDALEEKEAMTMDNTDLTIGSDASEAPTQLGVGASMEDAGGSNIVRIIQDMESRIAHLEARLDESVDARQQLERQVSAQTEELRVQRAAIARTQRALRSLNRADEEQATEPALRNPDTSPVSE